MKGITCSIAFLIIIFCTHTWAQHNLLYGTITDKNQRPVLDAQVIHESTERMDFSSKSGFYQIKNLKKGKSRLIVLKPGYKAIIDTIVIENENIQRDIVLELLEQQLQEVVVQDQKSDQTIGIQRLKGIEGTAIYESKKTEVIIPTEIALNSATNSARQLYAKVPGVQIWEGDEAGIQLNIGARGLSPNRSSNFNIRQNGYDISADALGYPESYYTPPVEAIERLEIVRGAASLQYGPQFGGLVNFVLKKPDYSKKWHVQTRQTVGSFGMFNSFNALGGNVGKIGYYGYFQHKQGNGWRANSNYSLQNGFVSLEWKLHDKIALRLEYTHMQNLSRQAGGLTDAQFQNNPIVTTRSRNWFAVNWNLLSANIDYYISSRTTWNTRTFANLSSRKSLGNLERIERVDDMLNRTLIQDDFQNIGLESRLLHRYKLLGYSAALVVGLRLYRGNTLSMQGAADSTSDPNFSYLNPSYPENSRYTLRGENLAAFAENVIHINKRWSITPGIRAENIRTSAVGYYRDIVRDKSGSIVVDNRNDEHKTYPRSFLLLGMGSSYRISENQEVYLNATQNYRSVTYSDIRIKNPNFIVDPNIRDERGYNIDLGIRGSLWNIVYFDMSVFYLYYKDRIGNILRQDIGPLFIPYRLQTNISDSRALGAEMYSEVEWLKSLFKLPYEWKGSVFQSLSFTDARYIQSENTAISGKYVEYVPPVLCRGGISVYNHKWLFTLQSQYVHTQYSDATNAVRSSNAAIGEIPAYIVTDFSARYIWKNWTFETGINNLTNERYFTRRAVSYPGPGILPSTPRNLYFTLGFKIGR